MNEYRVARFYGSRRTEGGLDPTHANQANPSIIRCVARPVSSTQRSSADMSLDDHTIRHV